jgi:hypothetical protein
MTLLPTDPPAALRPVPAALPEETAGGGGTTSWVPKSLPMMLLTNDPLPACVGGGGTTVGEVPALPLSSRRRSRAESADGGGAMTEGAGRLSFASRPASRSGAETGGGTTAALFICTREGETSRPMAAGAGGITLALRAGVERARSRETRVDAGAMMLESRDGAKSVCSDRTSGAGGTTAAFSAGALRDSSVEILGAGGTTELRVSPPRD